MERRVRVEDLQQNLGADDTVDHDARLGVLLKTGLALEHDERALAAFREAAARPGDLVDRALHTLRLVRTQRTVDPTAQSPDALHRAPELRLEDDDQRDRNH